MDDAIAAVAALLPDAALFAVGADRRVVFWSAAAERATGVPADEAVGRPWVEGSAIAGLAGVREAIRPLPSPDGRFAGAIGLLTVVTPAAAKTGDVVVFHGMVSRHPSMLAVFETIRNVARTEATVLVRGESGTGKELVARALHAESRRRDGPFVAVNCAALAPTLLESELFGHVRGAFTGAIADRPGIFAQADGGTLFLDEIAEIPLELQAKLLRALQERTITPVGGTRSIPVDVRIVAATHRSLREAVRAGRFREDLLYRLRVVPLFLPSLRERRSDVELLLRRFVDEQNAIGPRRVVTIAPEALAALVRHEWPGNVRELRNVVEHAFAVGRGPEIALADLPPELREGPAPRPPARDVLPDDDEARRIREALEATGGRVEQAARRLGMSRPTFWRKRKKHGV